MNICEGCTECTGKNKNTDPICTNINVDKIWETAMYHWDTYDFMNNNKEK